jgi:hypothetical protein
MFAQTSLVLAADPLQPRKVEAGSRDLADDRVLPRPGSEVDGDLQVTADGDDAP